ncbi:MAG: hypothetical protein U0R17_04390 [Acidimicrobiia bacterium]
MQDQDDQIVEVTLDALARYQAAMAGIVISQREIDALYPNSKAKRQKNMPSVQMTYSQSKDIWTVLETLGEEPGTNQLPSSPIRYLSPLIITEKIADHWTTTLQASRQDPSLTGIYSLELHDELKGLLTHLFDECRADAQDVNVPRRRKTDKQLDEAKMIDEISPIRNIEDQKVFAEVVGISDLDFKITKACVGALTTLISQHSQSIDLSGIREMYKRGLLPLSIIIENDEVLNAISKIVGRTKEQICESVSRVEESHIETRAQSIETLLDSYEAFIDATHKPVVKEAPAARPTKPAFKPSNTAHARTGPSEEEIKDAERRIEKAIERCAKLTVDATMTSELIDRHLFGTDPDLPTVDSIAGQSDPNHLRVTISTTNFWFKTAQVSRQAMVPITPAGQALKALEAIPVDNRALHVFSYLMKARLADTFVEGVIANSTGRYLLDQHVRDKDFIAAAKHLEALAESLGVYHLNTIETLSDHTKMKRSHVDTEKQWRKLIHNPILQVDRSGEFGCIDLSDTSRFEAGTFDRTFLLYHLPAPLTRPLFENTFGGIAWDLSHDQFERKLGEIDAADTTGRVIEKALSWKAQYGTSSSRISNREVPLELDFKDVEKLRELFKPISQRYELAIEGR